MVEERDGLLCGQWGGSRGWGGGYCNTYYNVRSYALPGSVEAPGAVKLQEGWEAVMKEVRAEL